MSIGTGRAHAELAAERQEPPRRHGTAVTGSGICAFAGLIACYVLLAGYDLFTVLGWSCRRDGQCPRTGRGPGTAEPDSPGPTIRVRPED